MHSKDLKSCTIHYNSDLSGEVIIVPKENPESEIRVLGEDLIEFIGGHFINEKKSALEQLSGVEYFKRL